MVGVGYKVQLDEFVQQREPVVDHRTKYSGIRKCDLVKAKSFDDIKGRVAALLKDRVLVRHAVHNDLKEDETIIAAAVSAPTRSTHKLTSSNTASRTGLDDYDKPEITLRSDSQKNITLMGKNRSKNKEKPPKRKDRQDEHLEPKFPKRKRQKTDDGGYRALLALPEAGPSRITLESIPTPPDPINLDGQAPPVPTNPSSKGTPKVAGDLKSTLQTMVEGSLSYSTKQKGPSKYLALDCEMVGVGPKGRQSSVARVSVVNYHGAVQLDEFVRQTKPVVDYRTKYSGVRQRDLVNAKSFGEIQSQVTGLLKDRVLLGHAVYNDLKALSLEHPQTQTLDTQSYAWKFKLSKVKNIALRHLVKQELGLTIQDGEHSSVTDARATMAVFRLHEREWEGGLSPPAAAASHKNENKKKRKLSWEEEHDLQSPVESAQARWAECERAQHGREE
ncbi:3'-5' exonuclease [Pleurotus pulmonarius]|nr:3'-5' exonuclease [Pleurotus pulmonarius]KAF4580659.1 3'-5' exonuclease [Pleurotus pulmonarius]